MLITSIEIKRIENSDSKLKGFAKITLDNRFAVQGIKILENEGHMFLGMPSRKKSDGGFFNMAHPTTIEFQKMMEEVIFAAYKEAGEYGCYELTLSLDKKYAKKDFRDLYYYDYELTTPSIQAIA